MPSIDGDKLRALRTREMLSMRDLALKADVAASTLVYLERGERPATFSTIKKLAKALGVDPKELLDSE